VANLRIIRRRIRSVQNTAKVTRAMQMVAASKMRRAQEQVLAARPYAQKIRQVLSELAAQNVGGDEQMHPLLQRRPIRKLLVVHITPDRGLCGGLPSNMNRRTAEFITENEQPVALIAVGKKGQDFMVRTRQDVAGVFLDLGDRPALADTLPITHLMESMYTSGDVDQVVLAYSRFVNTVVQEPTVMQVLPVEPPELAAPKATAGYIYEPDEAQVFAALLPRFLEMQVYQAVLESIASEQSARMVAMRNATEAADDMVDALTLQMNKVRQESITNELLDLVGGVAALEG
jgi:F-type H+-transporting ATPase subunit gamma